MAKSIKLSFVASQKRYTKMVNGDRWYSTRGLTDGEADQREAMKQFLDWAAEKENVPTSIRPYIDVTKGNWKTQMTDAYKGAFPNATKPKPTKNESKGGSLEDWAEQYLEFKSKQIKPSSLVPMRSHMAFFNDCAGNKTPKNFDLAAWDKFHEQLRLGIKQGKFSHKYANSILATVRGFFSWLGVKTNQGVPYFVNEKMYSIKIPNKQVTPFGHDEIKAIMEAATPMQKCHYLLMLNCGMTQQDLSDLTPDMIDWKNGTLTRKRGKHDHQSGDVPLVKYHLWDCTMKLLKKLGDKKGKTVFVNEVGNPLVGENRNDSVAAAFKDIRKKLNLGKGKTLKIFRKSGTSALGTSTKFKIWREVYLANSGSTITDRHYDGSTELPKEVTDFIESFLEICQTV